MCEYIHRTLDCSCPSVPCNSTLPDTLNAFVLLTLPSERKLRKLSGCPCVCVSVNDCVQCVI